MMNLRVSLHEQRPGDIQACVIMLVAGMRAHLHCYTALHRRIRQSKGKVMCATLSVISDSINLGQHF